MLRIVPFLDFAAEVLGALLGPPIITLNAGSKVSTSCVKDLAMTKKDLALTRALGPCVGVLWVLIRGISIVLCVLASITDRVWQNFILLPLEVLPSRFVG